MRVIDADEAKEKIKDMSTYSAHGYLLYVPDMLHKIDECQTLNIREEGTELILKKEGQTMDLLERATTLLTAAKDLLEKQDNSCYVLNLLRETVVYDGAECDGNCLKDDIDDWFDELAEQEDQAKLPSVTPKGKWVKVKNGRGGHECNICHTYAPSCQNGDEHLSRFCPNCGAKMDEVEE